jgi:predicted amino acid-binding ACT domain protein
VDDKLRQSGMILSSSRILRRLTTVAEALGYDSRDALLMAVGLNQCDADTVMAALQERQRRDDTRPLLRPTIVSLAEADMPQKLAACCRPAPPDSIVGYVTKQGVVTIHRADCYRVRQLRPLIQADWRHIEIQPQFEVQLVGVDRPGLLRDVTAVVADSGLNISRIHAEQAVDGSARILMVMEDIPRWQRDHVLDQLRRVPDVRRAEYQSPTSADNTTGFPWLRRHLQNPYTVRPVSGTAFFGRRAELRELINNLRDVRPGEAVLLWGPRRIGKTSLLLEFQQRVMNSEDYILVFMDMQRLSGRSVTMFLRDILKSIAQAITESRVKPPSLANMKRDPLGYFRGFIEQVPALQNKHLVLIMDEFQLLSNLHEERISLADVNRYFRSLIQHRSGLSIIFSGGGILDALLRQPDTSFMLEVARYQKIDCLDDTAARQLIVEPAPHVTYDELFAMALRRVDFPG